MKIGYVCNNLCKYRSNGLDTLEKCGQCPVQIEDIEISDENAAKLKKAIEKGDAFQIMPPIDSDIVKVLKEIRRELKDINQNLRALKK